MRIFFYLLTVLLCSTATAAIDPLPSWNEGSAKTRILEYVKQVDKNQVPQGQRVAVFDNDGTLWVEQPNYAQAQFTIDRVKALAPQHPEWKDIQPYKAILENDIEKIKSFPADEFAKVIAVTHSGMTVEEFQVIVKDWLKTAVHPILKRPYTKCVYQPMIELLTYMRAHKFKTFIVSGGGVEFMRAFAEATYGVPPEQVIGSSGLTQFEMIGNKAVLKKRPEIGSIDDKDRKPVNIDLHIGRRPLFAAGNSDGDLQMLQYTDNDESGRFMMLVHHDDSEREFAYDVNSPIGRLDKALVAAQQRGWLVVSMKRDFKVIFK